MDTTDPRIKQLVAQYYMLGLDYEIARNMGGGEPKMCELQDGDGNIQYLLLIPRPDLSNHDYTKHEVYDCLTTIDSFHKSMRAMSVCIEDDSMTIGEYKLLNEKHPSFDNYLKKHHDFKNVDGTEVMRYTIIQPYDD